MNYNIIVNQGNGIVCSYFITVDVNLLEKYKDALISGEGKIVWDKGVLDMKHVVGIIEN